MSSFSIDWLDLREPADLAARAPQLASQALQWLGAQHKDTAARIVVDLGSGTGSTLRALARIGASLQPTPPQLLWRLVDWNGALLNEALRRHGKGGWVEDYQADLNQVDELPLGSAHLVSASALFDLVSRDFIDALVARLDTQHTAIYAALNYDGTTQWSPKHPLDDAILAVFNQDQRRDKGFGVALGPDCTAYLQQALEQRGYKVSCCASPWQLNARRLPQHLPLVEALIEGIYAAVLEQAAGEVADKTAGGLTPADCAEWKAYRLAQAAQGDCIVGHWDLLALPA